MGCECLDPAAGPGRQTIIRVAKEPGPRTRLVLAPADPTEVEDSTQCLEVLGGGRQCGFTFAEVDRSKTSVLLDASIGLDIALDLGERQVILKRAGADDARLYEVT